MKITIERAFALSLAVHAAIILPLAIGMWPSEPDDDETLVVDLRGVTAEDQSEERVTEQTAGSKASQATSAQETLGRAGWRAADGRSGDGSRTCNRREPSKDDAGEDGHRLARLCEHQRGGAAAGSAQASSAS